MTTAGSAAEAARTAFHERITAPGHAVDNARLAVQGLEAAFAAGDLERTPPLERMLADLDLALAEPPAGDDPQRLGGKSAEAARLILRAIDRELASA